MANYTNNLATEQAQHAELNRARRKSGEENSEQNRGIKKEISIFEAGLLAAALGLIFDLPVYILAFVPVIGWVAGFFWGLTGKCAVIIWLICKQSLNFDTIKKSFGLFALTSAGFVIAFAARQRVEKVEIAGATDKI